MDVNLYTSQLRCALGTEINYKYTCDAYFQGITDNTHHIGTAFLHLLVYPSTTFSTRPQWVLPIQMTGYGTLHKAMGMVQSSPRNVILQGGWLPKGEAIMTRFS